MINQLQILGLNEILEGLESEKGENSLFLSSSGGAINGDLSVSGHKVESETLAISGESFFVSITSGNGRIAISPFILEDSNESYLMASSSDQSKIELMIESSDDEPKICIGGTSELTMTGIYSNGSISFVLNNEEAMKVSNNRTQFGLDVISSNIKLSSLLFTLESGQNTILDYFFTSKENTRQYDIYLYSGCPKTTISATIFERGGSGFLIYETGSMSLISGVEFSCSYGDGTVYLRAINSGLMGGQIEGFSTIRRYLK